MFLVSFRLFYKNLGNLQEFCGQMDYRPPGKKLPVRLWVNVGAFRDAQKQYLGGGGLLTYVNNNQNESSNVIF